LRQVFPWVSTKRLVSLIAIGALALFFTSPCNAQLLHKKKKVNKSTAPDNTAEPDKVLYERALEDIKHGRQEVGRLSLQTLINTYPDSEYLAKAKLSIADSYYKEGGTANTTQAIQGYKDFGIFFPFLPEAAYAQYQVANAHYRQMAKPDRDRSEAKAAEEEFQTFLQKFPKDPLAPKAEQNLRDVQEIIAEGDYRIGYFYYVKGDRRAAAARLMALAKRYPLYSKSDQALWMVGDIFERSEHKEIAALYYAQIVRNYPLSTLAPDAKSKLIAFKVPVPQADPKAMAWMTAEQNAPREHESLMKRPLGLVRTAPHAELMVAAKTGTPNLQPDADDTSATDILRGGNRSQLGGSGTTGNNAAVEVVTPGSGATSAGDTAAPADGTSSAPPPDGATAPATEPTATLTTGAATTPTAAQPAPAADSSATGTNGSGATTGTVGGSPEADAAPKSDAAASDQPAAADAAKTDGSTTTDQKESTSKKKKGLRKVIPW
jgi:outer membrane protein assembly factor BamD